MNSDFALPLMPTQSLPKTKLILIKRWHWLAISLLLVHIFYQLDLIYKRDGLIINNTGYYIGLTDLALTPLLAWGVLQSFRNPSPTINSILIALSSWFALSAMYFFIKIGRYGIGWLDSLFL